MNSPKKQFLIIILACLTVVTIITVWGQAASEPDLVEKALQAMGGAEEIVFAVRGIYSDGHYYANFGHWSDDPNKMMHSPDGSRLCKFNLRTRQVVTLLDDPKGGIRDPRVHYKGDKLLFAYRKGGTKYYHLYESNTDGAGLKQLTFGDWDDVDPEYLPDGGIIFVSTRSKRFVPCYHTQAGLLHRMEADGSGLLLLSGNNVGDHRPAILPDGRVLYTRWEYVDRAPQKFHSLWTMNPDGSDQMVLYGNSIPPDGKYYVMTDAMPIPGADKVVSIFSPEHGTRENAGDVMVVDPKAGPDDLSAARQISPKVKIGAAWTSASGWGGFRDPYPLSVDCFLVARDKSVLILDGRMATQEIFRAEEMVHDPRVIRSRPRERVLSSRSDPKKNIGQLVLANVYRGRNMNGIKPGEIKSLLVMEDLPKPISYYSLPGAISMDGSHTLHRILGTVPVEDDGSAAFEAPPLRGLFFVALDKQGMAVKRMQSYTMVMPGETLGCAGCHETRTETIQRSGGKLLALARAPRRIEPIPNIPEVLDYPRDIQPILNRHCITCHSAEKPSGHVVLTGDYNEWFTQSYYALFAYKQISDSWRYDENGNHPPYGFGTAISPLMKKIDGSHNNVKLSEHEHDLIRLWIEAGATFAGTYAAYNSSASAVAGALVNTPKIEFKEPIGSIVKNRCLTCHDSVANLGKRHEKGRVNLPKHCWNLYNLSYPEKSMILMAPLAKEAGGYGWCKNKSPDSQPVLIFRDTQDPDYQTILQAVQTAKARQEKAGRYDMPGFRPNEHYVRWMKRFGILPEGFDLVKDPIDPYEIDKAYWRSLWYCPPTAQTISVASQVSEGKNDK